jgi:hypothetical protein
VEFEHRHLERHGEAAQHIYDQVSQEGGWGGLLAMYAKEAAVSGS